MAYTAVTLQCLVLSLTFTPLAYYNFKHACKWIGENEHLYKFVSQNFGADSMDSSRELRPEYALNNKGPKVWWEPDAHTLIQWTMKFNGEPWKWPGHRKVKFAFCIMIYQEDYGIHLPLKVGYLCVYESHQQVINPYIIIF